MNIRSRFGLLIIAMVVAWSPAFALAQGEPPAPQTIRVSDGDGPIVYGALTGAILVLATVIAVLWRRGEKHRDESIKSAEAAREREVQRTEQVLARLADERGKFAEAIESQRKSFAEAIESQREDFIAALDAQRLSFEATIKAVVERQAISDEKRDAKISSVLEKTASVVESAQNRISRRGG